MRKSPFLRIICIISILTISVNVEESFAQSHSEVEVSIVKMNFPTYIMGSDEAHPMFKDFNLPGMSYFRSSRPVYPYTFQNKYTSIKTESIYEVIRLENEYIIADIIPSLRGRLQGAIDKRNGWDFLYYNNVIKPAEIAVRSAWISGGIEWTHPGGHG